MNKFHFGKIMMISAFNYMYTNMLIKIFKC